MGNRKIIRAATVRERENKMTNYKLRKKRRKINTPKWEESKDSLCEKIVGSVMLMGGTGKLVCPCVAMYG